MQSFLVRPEALERQAPVYGARAETLAMIAARLREAMPTAAATGSAEAEEAFIRYLDVWSRTVDLMAQTAAGIQMAVAASARGYTLADLVTGGSFDLLRDLLDGHQR